MIENEELKNYLVWFVILFAIFNGLFGSRILALLLLVCIAYFYLRKDKLQDWHNVKSLWSDVRNKKNISELIYKEDLSTTNLTEEENEEILKQLTEEFKEV